MTIQQYSRECRLKEAAALLRTTNRTISDIASALCFSNQSHLHREFRKKYVMTPAQYRYRGND